MDAFLGARVYQLADDLKRNRWSYPVAAVAGVGLFV